MTVSTETPHLLFKPCVYNGHPTRRKTHSRVLKRLVLESEGVESKPRTIQIRNSLQIMQKVQEEECGAGNEHKSGLILESILST